MTHTTDTLVYGNRRHDLKHSKEEYKFPTMTDAENAGYVSAEKFNRIEVGTNCHIDSIDVTAGAWYGYDYQLCLVRQYPTVSIPLSNIAPSLYLSKEQNRARREGVCWSAYHKLDVAEIATRAREIVKAWRLEEHAYKYIVLEFGAYKGKTVEEVLATDREYFMRRIDDVSGFWKSLFETIQLEEEIFPTSDEEFSDWLHR